MYFEYFGTSWYSVLRQKNTKIRATKTEPIFNLITSVEESTSSPVQYILHSAVFITLRVLKIQYYC